MIFRYLSSFTACFLVIVAGTALWSQEPKAAASTSTYRLDYVFSELQDNKRINTRNYTLLVRAKDKGVIKLGSRVPILVGKSKEGDNQIQYLDIGMNIDCRISEELESGIDLITSADTSSLVPKSLPQSQRENNTGDPVIRQERYDLENIVPLGKQTLLSSADEVDGTRRLQVEVTATKVR